MGQRGEQRMTFLGKWFQRWKDQDATSSRSKHHSVYVVWLEGVPGGGGKDVYVGMTGLTPEERFANHKKGHKKNYKVMKYGVKLLPELYQNLNPMTYKDASQMEKVLANQLTKEGFHVYGGH